MPLRDIAIEPSSKGVLIIERPAKSRLAYLIQLVVAPAPRRRDVDIEHTSWRTRRRKGGFLRRVFVCQKGNPHLADDAVNNALSRVHPSRPKRWTLDVEKRDRHAGKQAEP